MTKIDRSHARQFYDWWADRLRPKGNYKPLKPNSANRDLGTLRKLYREYWEYEGQEERDNPFRKLRFKDVVMAETSPFDDKWVQTRILKPGVFKGLNKDAVMLSLALIETGCRPSEIANILPESIILDGDTPFIRIRGRSDMELKSMASNRDIPLVGVSLCAFKEMPDGFARYRDKNALLSATLMKAFCARKLFPTDKHRVYSFRHSFEKRMLEAGLDYGLRCILMGLANSRPAYGDGGSIAYRKNELLKICHPVSDSLKAWMASYA